MRSNRLTSGGSVRPSISHDHLRCFQADTAMHCVHAWLSGVKANLTLVDPLPPRGSRGLGRHSIQLDNTGNASSQAILFGQLDYLAWQLRIRDGASAAMPSSLRRQLIKSSRTKQGKGQPAGHLCSTREGDLHTGGEVTSCLLADNADVLGACPPFRT